MVKSILVNCCHLIQFVVMFQWFLLDFCDFLVQMDWAWIKTSWAQIHRGTSGSVTSTLQLQSAEAEVMMQPLPNGWQLLTIFLDRPSWTNMMKHHVRNFDNNKQLMLIVSYLQQLPTENKNSAHTHIRMTWQTIDNLQSQLWQWTVDSKFRMQHGIWKQLTLKKLSNNLSKWQIELNSHTFIAR